MTINIQRLIAAINPNVYCDPTVREEVNRMIQDERSKINYAKVAEVARLKEPNQFQDLEAANPFNLAGLRAPIEQHTIVYDSMEQSLEGLYFFILDLCEKLEGWEVTKALDSFAASPGSSVFGEMIRRRMQAQEAWQRLQGVTQGLLHSIVGQLAELRFHRRALDLLSAHKSGSGSQKEAALLALKQIWLDRMNATGSAGYRLSADDLGAFLETKSGEVSSFDDWRSALARQLLDEFEQWLGHAERELLRQHDLARNQLLQDVEKLKLYARWAAAYLRQARDLEQNAQIRAGLVTVFESAVSELALLAQGTFPLEAWVKEGGLPRIFLRTTNRVAKPVVLLEFSLRMAPKSLGHGSFVYRGRAMIKLSSYALTDEELTILIQEITRDELRDLIGAADDSMEEHVDRLLNDIDEALGGDAKNPKTSTERDTNPFAALFALIPSLIHRLRSRGTTAMGRPKPDSELEQVVRSEAILQARYACRGLYDAIKKMIHAPTFEIHSGHGLL